MEKKFAYLTENEERCYPLTRMEGDFSNMLMNITVYQLLKGEEKEFLCKEEEIAVLLVEGEIQYTCNNIIETAIRHSFIQDGPYCLHTSKGNRVTVKAIQNSEILVQSTSNWQDFGVHFYKPSHCSIHVSGEGLFENKAKRVVRTIFDYQNAPYSNMVMGEVISEQGGWSSYIPHHHPQPEVYYYRYERPEAFGASFIGEEAFKVKDRSFSAIPGGYTHPQVSAPAYPMYYCWMIRHLTDNPWTQRVDDERYLWLVSQE